MYIPRPWHQVGPFILLLVGLYVGHNFKPATYDVVLFCIGIYWMAITIEWYLAVAGVMYQRYMTGYEEEKQQPQRSVIIKSNESNAGIASMQLTVEKPRIDKERDLAITLLRMKEAGQVNLTEGRWVKTGKFPRSEFISTIDKWHYNGVIQREDKSRKNSPYMVKDWEKVMLIARGERFLEPPPRSN